jgi:hypothetical protein
MTDEEWALVAPLIPPSKRGEEYGDIKIQFPGVFQKQRRRTGNGLTVPLFLMSLVGNN